MEKENIKLSALVTADYNFPDIANKTELEFREKTRDCSNLTSEPILMQQRYKLRAKGIHGRRVKKNKVFSALKNLTIWKYFQT
ncbi:Hypothetical predicted protein [Octopus vulgaris]|uniref:Uncharacterized protein n=1 Tax=Octopus vulgaris TaxID=6645 RepID=A0AA36AZ49_OCTVU|nr:Hypothetical predicted protein [Octopus vulgaris]